MAIVIGTVVRRQRASRGGFTLADLAITVLIVGILATVTVPKYADSMAHIRVEAAAKRIAADLQYARQHAKAASVSQSVVFTPGKVTYDLPGISDIDHAGRPYTVDLSKTSYPPSSVSASFGSGGGTVTFDIFGQPDSGGTVIVQVVDAQRTITVDGTSGRVSVQP